MTGQLEEAGRFTGGDGGTNAVPSAAPKGSVAEEEGEEGEEPVVTVHVGSHGPCGWGDGGPPA